MKSGILIVFLIVFLILMVLVGPLITIWSLNTLFNLGIDYTFWTWLATAWLCLVTFGNVASSIRNKD